MNYKINVLIFNDIGELADKQLCFKTLDDMRSTLFNTDFVSKMIDEAEEYAKENNMLTEELFDSKEEAELNKEDLI